MRARPWILASVGLNLVLAAGWLTATKPVSITSSPAPTADEKTIQGQTRTIAVVRRQYFTWQQVESDDYSTYIRNLRAIGCPEQTIRDLIVADVNQLYARRRMAEIVSPDQQWWRSDPDPGVVEEAAQKIKDLDAERRALLTKLLGSGWENEGNPLPPIVRAGISLTGPILGDLTSEKKQSVYDTVQRTEQKIAAYREAQRLAGKPVDEAEIARIRLESRTELAAVLTPEQYEEFMLRYSQTAVQMREELRGLSLTPEEFRILFRSRDPLETQPDLYYSGTDPEAIKKQQAMESQIDNAIKNVLGPDRYAAYQLNQDPVYCHSRETARQLGVPESKVMPIYEINSLTEAELDRIRSDPSLTNEEKVEAIAAVQVDQQKSLEKILGPEAFERWLETKGH